DHREELRTPLIRAIVGFCVALVFSFFVGRVVMRFIAAPVEAELQNYWDRYNKKKHKEVLQALREGTLSHGRPMQTTMRVDIRALKKALNWEGKDGERPPALDVIPPLHSLFKDLEI